MISHRHRAIFVHIPKTGGQSIETVFLDDLGLGWKERGRIGLRNNPDPAKGPQKLAHLHAHEYVALGHVTQDEWDSYTTFAVIRHPFDRMISEFRYRLAAAQRRGEGLPEEPGAAFDAFIRQDPRSTRSDLVRHLQPQADYVLGVDGRVLVDHLIRFEDMPDGLAPVFGRLFDGPRRLPHKNRSKLMSGFTRDSLSREQTAFLTDRYAADFAAFGYQP